MNTNLTNSAVDRQNILNNPDFLEKIQTFLGITGMLYDGEYRFTVAQVADFYGVNVKTLRRHIEASEKELAHNGYCVLKGRRLTEFKNAFAHLIYSDLDDGFERDSDVPLKSKETDKQRLIKTRTLGTFNFSAFLNIAWMVAKTFAIILNAIALLAFSYLTLRQR